MVSAICANLVERLAGEVPESDDDVGDLDAGVVDVVLHFDRDAAEAQDADERIAERGVAQVADVGRLVGVDGRVLDDGLAAGGASRAGGRRGEPIEQKRRARQEEVQVAVGRGGDALDALERAEVAGDLLRDGPRRLAQPPRQLEGDRRAEIAEVAVGRVLEGERRLRRRVQRSSAWSAGARGAREVDRERAGSSAMASGDE